MLCTTNQVRLLLLSRDEVTITRFVKKEFRSIEMITDIVLNNRSDISRFITEQVRQLVKEKQFLAKIQTSMTETLEQQACGMFQWVKLVADALKYCETEDAAIDILEHFPQDLHAAYQKTMHRLLSTPGFNAPRCVLALKWLVCAKRPMQLHELSVAMKIDEEWKKRSNPSLELTDIVESSSNSVLQYDDEVLESEFKRLLGPLAEFHRQINQNWDKVYGVTIHLCHHSLAQFLLHQSSWDGIGFNGLGPVPYYDPPFQESMVHALLTETCMKMMSSGESLERYLAEFYHPELTMTNAPFLNYAFENWTHHLQQSANLSDQLQNLIGWNEIILQQNLKLSLIVIGSLADIFGKIEIKKIKQLMQSIAVRDFQAKLLPATKAIADALPTLPAITEHLSTMISHTQSSNGRLARMRATRSQGEAHDLKVYALDSITIAETLKLIKDDPTLRENMESRMIHLRAASQQLRDLAISLSVDPIRGYIYRHVGNSGINPIPVLAQAAHIVDIFMSYPVLPLMNNEIGGFQEQFLTEIGHPLYGPITSVRLELEERESRVLTPAFYKEHILNHYSFKKSEWSSIHLGVQIMEITDNSWRRGALDFLVLWWQAFVLKIPLTNRNGQARPSEKFADTKFRSFEGDTIGITDYVYFFPRLTVLYCIKVIMLMFPELERIFIQIGAKVIILVSDMPVKLRLLFRKGNSVYGFLFYIARLYMMPWLFASVRNKPLEDIQGVFNDPFQYKAAFEERSWKKTVFFLVQETIYLGINSAFSEERISSNEMNPYLPWEVYAPIYLPFFSLVSLERLLFDIIYIAFDIIRFGAFILTPNSWSWDQFTHAAGSILGQVIVKQLGIWGTLVFLSRLWLFQWLWGWLHLHSLLIKIIDLLKSLLELINWQPLSLHIRGISNVITQSLERLLPQLERGTMSILYSILYAAFFAVLFLLIRDPLRSYHGRRSCSKARRIALQSINTQDANQLLHWRAPTQRKDTLGLVDLENLEKLGSEEQREQGQ
ncbi:hypothetical protein CPB86DRAFT_460835 [Serendipita vermifera]|nr:hypothetical protein CPB86DRAFT_460835 [Serendipita vermifera]